jgi:hypothetical protein
MRKRNIVALLAGLGVMAHLAFSLLLRDVVTRVVVSADAPDMLDGPGSVLVLDTNVAENPHNILNHFTEFWRKLQIHDHRTFAEPGVPFVYIKVELGPDTYVVLSSSSLVDERQVSNPVNVTMWKCLNQLAVDIEDVEKAVELAEKSQIVDSIRGEEGHGEEDQGSKFDK